MSTNRLGASTTNPRGRPPWNPDERARFGIKSTSRHGAISGAGGRLMPPYGSPVRRLLPVERPFSVAADHRVFHPRRRRQDRQPRAGSVAWRRGVEWLTRRPHPGPPPPTDRDPLAGFPRTWRGLRLAADLDRERRARAGAIEAEAPLRQRCFPAGPLAPDTPAHSVDRCAAPGRAIRSSAGPNTNPPLHVEIVAERPP